MHIKGGLNGQKGNPKDPNDEGVFVSKVNSSGAARRDGRLKVGMRLLEVNGHSLLGATHQEAVDILRASGNQLHMVVCKGYDKSDVNYAIGGSNVKLGGTRSETGSESFSQSASSLDREEEENSIARQPTPPPTPKDDFEVLSDAQISELATQNLNEDLNQIVPVNYDDQALVSMKEKSTQEKVDFEFKCF